ncbi:hypothetical protein BJ170DRAFT_205692 [Xylariales sp. AK1849]|nr:hypothetical protein BJ170DRAFT_205692 [Xylariales sp. AK1849]
MTGGLVGTVTVLLGLGRLLILHLLDPCWLSVSWLSSLAKTLAHLLSLIWSPIPFVPNTLFRRIFGCTVTRTRVGHKAANLLPSLLRIIQMGMITWSSTNQSGDFMRSLPSRTLIWRAAYPSNTTRPREILSIIRLDLDCLDICMLLILNVHQDCDIGAITNIVTR